MLFSMATLASHYFGLRLACLRPQHLRRHARMHAWYACICRGLDYVIFKAGQHGVKLVLALGNFWRAYEQGPERWLAWAQAAEVGSNGGSGGFINGSGFGGGGGGSDVAAFYANPGARQLYKRHIEAVLGRVNTYTGGLER